MSGINHPALDDLISHDPFKDSIRYQWLIYNECLRRGRD
jgi:hypothetical protein